MSLLFENNFTKINKYHKHNTRSSRFNYAMLKIKVIESKTFYFNAIQDWNLLSDLIKSITDLQMFKKIVKHYLKCTSEELERCVISYRKKLS